MTCSLRDLIGWPPVSVFVRRDTGYPWASITIYIGHCGREFRVFKSQRR